MIRCEDGVSIHSWLLLHPNSKVQKKPTIVFFHGNAGNIGLRLPNAHQMYTQLNANILMVEYRGYGDSDSVKPTEEGLKLDAEAALDFISSHPQIDPQRIFCFGRSLGGAVAFHLAKHAETHHKPLAGIMVENTFLSIGTMVDQLMPLIAPLKFLVLRMDWGNDRIAPFLRTPVLYLAGDSDELVPHNHMTKLYEYSSKCSSYTKMHIIKGGTHNDSWMVGGSEYFEKMRSFISYIMLNESDHNFHGNDSTGSLDCPGRVSTDSDSVEVNMGQEGMTSMNSMERNSIPIMPRNFLGIAKEATKLNKESVGSDKKKS
jgi:pimeloyl-ACP methyl ester carboxylesterase